MPRPPRDKVTPIGNVRVTQAGELWLIRYRDPQTGRDVRRRLRNRKEEYVMRIASTLAQEVDAKKGLLPLRPEMAPSLTDVMDEALGLCRHRPKVAREWRRQADRWLEWMAENHSNVRTWSDLRPAMLLAYLRELEARLAPDSVIDALKPVKAAWRHATENWPDAVRPLPKLRLAAPPQRREDALTAAEVAALLGWLKKNNRELWGMATLQALAGLRMLEAAALRPRDVDLNAGTVSVTNTEHHDPKTRSSKRTIPVCREVIATIKPFWTQADRKKLPYLFLNEKGKPFTKNALGLRWSRVRRRAAEDLSASILKVPPRRLRASFSTMAGRLGADDRVISAYMGHSPKGVLGHYRLIKFDDLQALALVMDGWPRLIKIKKAGR